MKNSLKKNNAMTLAELIVSSILVGVVITGALSADYAIRSWHKRIEDRTDTQQKLVAAMEQIITDGESAIGNGIVKLSGRSGSTNYGVSYNVDSASPASWIGFRYENAPGHIPSDAIHLYAYSPNHPDIVAKNHNPDYLKRCWFDEQWCDLCECEDFIKIANPMNFFTINKNATTGKVSSITITLKACPHPPCPDPADIDYNEQILKNPIYTVQTSFYPKSVHQ